MHPPEEWLPERLDRAAEFLRNAHSLAVLTGAGISAESGIPTFRGAGGLWEGRNVEEVATPQAFRRDPAMVWRFYNERRTKRKQVKPNPGHFALAELERRFLDRFTLITQNVDGLHLEAGNQRVLEIHGALRRVRCTGCELIEDRGAEDLPDLPGCPACGELLRPDIVWFGEALPEGLWERAEDAVHECDVLMVVGTSAVVYPAAGLVLQARQHGAKLIEFNLTPTAATGIVDVALHGPSGVLLPDLVQRLTT